jgi:hypothetical protein
MHIVLQVQYLLFLSDFLMKPKFSLQAFEKYYKIKFHENPSSGAGLFHADGQTDRMKLIVAFRNVANAPKNSVYVMCAHALVSGRDRNDWWQIIAEPEAGSNKQTVRVPMLQSVM